jgi:hypothetical protein
LTWQVEQQLKVAARREDADIALRETVVFLMYYVIGLEEMLETPELKSKNALVLRELRDRIRAAYPPEPDEEDQKP